MDCYNCFLPSLIKRHLNEHIIYRHFSFLIQKSFLNLLSLLHNLTYLPLLDSFLFLSTFSVFLKSLNNNFFQMAYLQVCSVLINCTMRSSFFLHPAVSYVFHGPGFSGSRFFKVQEFQGPGFSGARFFRVQIFLHPVLESGSRIGVQVLVGDNRFYIKYTGSQ